MAAPYEILGAPVTLYLAPVGTTVPDIDDAEGAFNVAWFKVGTSGDKNYSEDGVTLGLEETLNVFRGAGSTLPRKVFRTEEDVMLSVNIADLSPTQFAKQINDATITTVAASTGVPGEKSFSLAKGLQVKTFALLARGLSTVNDTLNAQYEVASVYCAGNKSIQHTKGQPALLACEFRTVDAAGTGAGITHRIQTAAAT